MTVRLVGIAALVGLGGILVAGGVLLSLYERALRNSFDERLSVYLISLIATAVDAEGRMEEPQGLGDPNFTIPQSGWGWQVDGGDRVYLSRSLLGEAVAVPDDGGDAPIIYADTSAMGGLDLRLASRSLVLPDATAATFTIVGDPDELERSIRAFRTATFVTLSILAAAIMLAAFVQVRLGLAPLRELRQNISDIARGRSRRLDGDYPVELDRLVAELNGLLRLNEELIERARTHVGNLAHALKTPLSVVVNEARERDDEKIVEQASLMRERIDIALDRARMAARSGAIGEVSEVAPPLEGLARVMRKLHGERGITVAVDADDTLLFRGEKQDFEELVGNIVDNACKWASSEVRVLAKPVRGRNDVPMVELIVDDDGPGLPAEKRGIALQRGRRLDETVPGSGLGLSIVTELVELYGGTIALGDAALGGLRVTVRLPAVDP
ncbi:MAG: ATP-binding protein [Pseudomonadota bacterium]